MVAFDTTSKSLCRKKVHQLCKDRFARIHQPSAAVKVAEASAGLVLNSNRSLCAWGLTFSISITYSQRSNKRWDSTDLRSMLSRRQVEQLVMRCRVPSTLIQWLRTLDQPIR